MSRFYAFILCVLLLALSVSAQSSSSSSAAQIIGNSSTGVASSSSVFSTAVVNITSSSTAIVNVTSSSSTGVFNLSSSSTGFSSSSSVDPNNIYIGCGNLLLKNATTLYITSTSTQFQLSIFSDLKDDMTAPTVYLRRGYTYFLKPATVLSVDFDIGTLSSTGFIVNASVSIPAGANGTYAVVADPSGSGVAQFWYGSTTTAFMGSQLFVADSNSQCPESSTGETILYPNSGATSMASLVIAAICAVLSIVATL